jgi:hypothetical protein
VLLLGPCPAEDERFLVKTMRKSEMSVLLGMLEQYSEHMERYPNSLITRFFGLHKVTPAHGRSVSCCCCWAGVKLCLQLDGFMGWAVWSQGWLAACTGQ